MPLNRLTPPNMVAIHPGTGRPVSGGSVRFYTAGTTTPKPAYLDREGTIEAPNPMPLDAGGMCDVYLDGLYRLDVYDAVGEKLYDRDYVSAETAGETGSVEGALLAVNNLSDVPDKNAARQTLGLDKQSGTADRTPGRLMIVGAFGLGGNAPLVSGSGALGDPSALGTGWVRVDQASVSTVGGPNGAPAGVCQTLKHTGSAASQAYYPTDGSQNSTPWRRSYSAGSWSPWRRDMASFDGNNGGGWYYRYADGRQVCVIDKLQLTYNSPDNCLGTWTFPIQFFGRPHHISASLRPAADGGNATTIGNNCAPGMPELNAPFPGAINVGSCHFRVYRQEGGTSFVSGNHVWVSAMAEGRWY